MMRTVAVALLLAAPGALGASSYGRGHTFLSGGMQPEVVARTLADVVDEWKAEAALFADCNATHGDAVVDCADAPNAFQKSCHIVAMAVVEGASGDKSVAKEYLADVCGEKVLTGWRQGRCASLSQAILGMMSADSYDNRQTFNAGKLCGSFWLTFAEEEKARVAKEEADRQAQEKKAAEEAAARQKKAAEEAAAEAKRLKEEEAKRLEEEAKAQAEAAAKLVEAKKAEAEAVAKAAKQKAEDAARAEQKHKEMLEKAKEAEKKIAAKAAPKAASKPVAAKKSAPAATKAAPAAKVAAKGVTTPQPHARK